MIFFALTARILKLHKRIFKPWQNKRSSTNIRTAYQETYGQYETSDSVLSMVDHYCKSLDTIVLNELQFTKWFPDKYYDQFDDGSDNDVWNNNFDSDNDRDWIVGYVSPYFLTYLPQVKNLFNIKGILFCRLYKNWKDQVDTIALKDVLVGDGFLKALRNSYDEVKMTIHRSETRPGRGNIVHINFRIVGALFTPKDKVDRIKSWFEIKRMRFITSLTRIIFAG